MIQNQDLDYGKYDNLKYHKLIGVAIIGILVFISLLFSVKAETILIYNGTSATNTIGDQSGDTRKVCQEFNNATALNINAVSMRLGIGTADDTHYLLFNVTENTPTNTVLFSKQILKTSINASGNNWVNLANASLQTGSGKNYMFCLSCNNCAPSSNKNFEFNNQQTYEFNSMTWLYWYTGSYKNTTGSNAMVVYLSSGVTPQTPTITLLSDLKNGTVTNSTNFNIFFNQTSLNNSNNYWCGIYENTTLKNNINTSITGNNNLSFSLTGNYERYLNFTLKCFNENASANLSALYYVDNVKNVLNYAYPNGSYYNDVALYTNFSISDTNLYAFEWLVYQGTTLKENITHIGIKTYSYSVYNLSAVSQIIGNYNWILNVWENHNPLTSADLFKEYNVIKNNSELIFKDDKNSYSIISKENLEVKTETKDLKQYFSFQPITKEPPKYYTYYVKYSGNIEYIKDSQYKGHFVMWDLKRYIDFQCKNDVKVIKENDNLYRIETLCSDFETTGNLNYIQYTGNFSITAPPSLSDEYLLSLNETVYTQSVVLNNNINLLNEAVKMLWFIILLLGSSILPYIMSRDSKRTLLYIGIVLLGMLFYINEFMNYFNLEFNPQRFFNIVIFAVIVIHIVNLFED